MKRTCIMIAAAAFSATTVQAADTPAAEVAYNDMGAVEASLTGVAGDVEAGRKVMTTRGLGNCIACHEVTTLKEFPFHGEIGPSLDGVGDRWEEADLRGIVANAKKMFDGTMMPAFYKSAGYIRPGNGFTGKAAKPEDLDTLLTAQQVEDVVAYLMTLKEN